MKKSLISLVGGYLLMTASFGYVCYSQSQDSRECLNLKEKIALGISGLGSVIFNYQAYKFGRKRKDD